MYLDTKEATSIMFNLLAVPSFLDTNRLVYVLFQVGDFSNSMFPLLTTFICLVLLYAAFSRKRSAAQFENEDFAAFGNFFPRQSVETRRFSSVTFDTRSDRAFLIQFDETINDLENYCSDDIFAFDGSIKIN